MNGETPVEKPLSNGVEIQKQSLGALTPGGAVLVRLWQDSPVNQNLHPALPATEATPTENTA